MTRPTGPATAPWAQQRGRPSGLRGSCASEVRESRSPGARVRDTKAVGAKSLAVRTDKAGRYAFNSPPGKVGAEVTDLPGAYVLSPALIVRDLTVPADVERFTLPPIEVERGAGVNGVVVDEAGRPVAGATVGGQWRLDGPGWTMRAVVGATTAADGTFQLEGIQPGAKVAALWARHGDQATVESPRARAGRGRPFDAAGLRVRHAGDHWPRGRARRPARGRRGRQRFPPDALCRGQRGLRWSRPFRQLGRGPHRA